LSSGQVPDLHDRSDKVIAYLETLCKQTRCSLRPALVLMKSAMVCSIEAASDGPEKKKTTKKLAI